MKKLFQIGKKIFTPLRYTHKAPAFSALVCFIAGVLSYSFLSKSFQFPPIFLILSICLAVALSRKTTILFYICGFIVIPSQFKFEQSHLTIDTPQRYDIVFSHTPYYSSGKETLQKVFIKDQHSSTPVLCRTKEQLLPGQALSVIGTVKLNERQTSQTKFLLEVDSVVSRSNPSQLFSTVNSVLSKQSRKIQPLLNALYTGNRVDLSRNTRYLFKCNGLSHLLALSGLHIGTLILTLALLLKPLFISKHIKALIYITLPWLIIVITGTSSSIIRALLMSSIYFSAQCICRPSSGLNSVGLAGIIILTTSPHSLFTPGFQLSFSAVTGIIVAIQATTRLSTQGLVQKAALFFVVPIAASLATFPIILFFFEEFKPFSIVPNMIFTPFFSVVFTFSTLLLPFNAFPLIKAAIDYTWLFFFSCLRIFTEIIPIATFSFQQNMFVLTTLVMLLLVISCDSKFRRFALVLCCLVTVSLVVTSSLNSIHTPLAVRELELYSETNFKTIPKSTQAEIAVVSSSPEFLSEALFYLKKNRNFHSIFVISTAIHPKEKRELEMAGIRFLESGDSIAVDNVAIFP